MPTVQPDELIRRDGDTCGFREVECRSLGVIGVVAGPFLVITGGLNMFQVMVDAAFARAPLFSSSYSYVPALAYVWPVVTLVVGLCALPLGWISLFRGLAMAWPRRFDRSM